MMKRDLDAAIAQIKALLQECAEPGWDGSGGQPLSEVAAKAAAELVRALPGDVRLPEFAPEPDGSISLDWIEARDRLFTLSIGGGNRLAYAWLDGEDRGHAVAGFKKGTVPKRILEGIRGIVNDGPAVRAS